MKRRIAIVLSLVAVGAEPTSAAAQSCVPDCGRGSVCVERQCIVECSPPCAAGATCTADGCRAPRVVDPAAVSVAGVAPVPVCDGADPLAAAQARDRGRDLYRQAVSRPSGPDVALMAAALAEFDRQCAAGDDFALELRASALLVVGRTVEAARTLDAFLRLHPMQTLAAEVRARVEGNVPLFYERIGSIRVVTNAPNALVRIGDAPPEPVDGRLLRVPPGTIEVSVWAPGAVRPVTHAIQLRAGQTIEARFDLEPAHRAEARAPAPEPASAPLAPELTPALTLPVAGEAREPGDEIHLAPWAVTAGVLGGLLLAGGGVAAGIHLERADVYEAEGCPETPSMPGCDDVLSEFELAGTVRTALFIAGGVLAAASIALVIVDVAAGDDGSSDDASLPCVPAVGGGVGLACGARF